MNEATRLVLVRHGESQVTVDRVVGGLNTCTGLSPLGRRQAEALHRRLAATGEIAADVLVSSTMPWARETAEIIAPALGLDVVEDAELCEHHPGEGDGLAFDAFIERYGSPDFERNPYLPMSPGGESLFEFHFRVGRALHRLAQEHEGQTVVVACHGGVVDVAMRSLLGLPMVGRFDLYTLNTSLTEFARREGRRSWRLVRYNDTAHLADLDADGDASCAVPVPGEAVQAAGRSS